MQSAIWACLHSKLACSLLHWVDADFFCCTIVPVSRTTFLLDRNESQMTDLPVISCLLNTILFPPAKWESGNAESSNKEPCLLTCMVWLTILMALVEGFVQLVLLVSKRCPGLFEGVSYFQEDESPTERIIRIQRCLQISLFNKSSDFGPCCPVCLNTFDDGELVVSGLRQCCKNCFHHECLSSWLQIQSTCPCCRHEILHSEKSC